MKRPRLRTLSPEDARRAGYALASLLSLVVVTCASATRGPAATAGAPAICGTECSTGFDCVTSVARGPAWRWPSKARRLPLFELSQKHAAPMRVLFLSDSHAAAIFGLTRFSIAPSTGRRPGGCSSRPRRFVVRSRATESGACNGVDASGGRRVRPRRDARPEAADSSVTVELSRCRVGAARWDLAFSALRRTGRGSGQW
jgi:hypothetical protein